MAKDVAGQGTESASRLTKLSEEVLSAQGKFSRTALGCADDGVRVIGAFTRLGPGENLVLVHFTRRHAFLVGDNFEERPAVASCM